jgi:hypothetical protein
MRGGVYGVPAHQLTLQFSSSSVSRLLSNLRPSRLEVRLEGEAEWFASMVMVWPPAQIITCARAKRNRYGVAEPTCTPD